jgi:hypothetical protein
MHQGLQLLIDAAMYVELRDELGAQRKSATKNSGSGQNRKRKRNGISSLSNSTSNGNQYQNPPLIIPNSSGSFAPGTQLVPFASSATPTSTPGISTPTAKVVFSRAGPGFLVSDQPVKLPGDIIGRQRTISYHSQPLIPTNSKPSVITNRVRSTSDNSGLNPGGGYRGNPTNRQAHNTLEKLRRAQLQESFLLVKRELPDYDPRSKNSNLGVLNRAIRFIKSLERRETELGYDVARLTRERAQLTQRLQEATAASQKMDDCVSDANSNHSMESLEFNYPITIAAAPASGEQSPIDVNSGVFEKASNNNNNNNESKSGEKELDNGKYFEAKVCPCQVESSV